MKFDVNVRQEARCTRVEAQGQAGLGRLLSLLQVLALDCADWPHAAVLFDLRGLDAQLTGDEQARLAAAIGRALRTRAKVAVLTRPPALPEAQGLRAFTSEDAARQWLQES